MCKKKFSIKELAYNYKKAGKNVVRQLSSANKDLTNKVSRTLKQASLSRIESYLDELQKLFEKLKQTDELDLIILVRASCCLLDSPSQTFSTSQLLLSRP